MHNKEFDAIIIGAGAAGMMCAQMIAASNKRVLILDHSAKLAEKIRISGGGRCNFTNINARPECYISQNKHFATSALSRYTPYHFTELLDRYDIGYHEKTLGQLFCNQKSQAIIDLLDQLCQENGVIRLMETSILAIEKTNARFKVETNKGLFDSDMLVVACGGLSIPLIGATGFGYQIARQFGLKIIDTRPALVPLTLDQSSLQTFSSLSGISFDSETKIGKISFRENSLFTHRGLSGPAILQISSYWQHSEAIKINLLPGEDIKSVIQDNRSSTKRLKNFLHDFFSERLAESICSLLDIDKQLSQLNNKEIDKITDFIHNFEVIPNGTEGYKKAEVTKGGVDTAYLNSKSMMAKNVDGLYFIGEVVDVTGWLGGYNFQWAWSSAYAVASSI